MPGPPAARARVRRPRVRDAGTATAELAVVLPSLLVLAALAVWAVLAVAAHLRCVDAAGVGARALARGESPDTVTSVVKRIAPPGATIHLQAAGDLVVVDVRATVRLPGPFNGAGPALHVGDRAVAAAEDPATSPVNTGSGTAADP